NPVEGFSGHSDRRQLLHYLRNLSAKPRNLVLNHGEPNAIESFRRQVDREKEKLGLRGTKIYTPQILDSLRVA
ncbi:MAG: MBL fold metallo-hydrolase RNA specificity domain-containing protein, partial [Sulfolobaceae archaeon]